MILPRLLRQQSPLRAAQRCTLRVAQLPQRRSVGHLGPDAVKPAQHVPALANHDSTFQEHGVPGLLSQFGFKTAWTDYQGLMVEKLNEHIAGTGLENETTMTIAVKTAREPQFAATFNVASMAYNNHFFFESLAPESKAIPDDLAESLSASFSSIDTFRADLLVTADAMFGPGFVWLVWHKQPSAPNKGSWKLLPTYLAGSPLSDAHWRQQSVDMNTQNARSAGGLSGADIARQSQVQNTAGIMGAYSAGAKRNRAPGGADIVPVLCVNTWEHVWLPDWGVKGKRLFLEQWWNRIDWNVVHARTPPDALPRRAQAGLAGTWTGRA